MTDRLSITSVSLTPHCGDTRLLWRHQITAETSNCKRYSLTGETLEERVTQTQKPVIRFKVTIQRYKEAKMQRMPYVCRLFPAKEPYTPWLLCGKRPAT